MRMLLLPNRDRLRYACSTNVERNAIDTRLFLKHLEQTHIKTDDPNAHCPNHTVIIKGDFTYKGSHGRPISSYLRNRIYDECGDGRVKRSDETKIDPALKFYYQVPLMMTSNKRLNEALANGTSCYGMYIKLKEGCSYKKENWGGYMVNTIQASKLQYMICKREKVSTGQQQYFKIKPEQCQVTAKLKDIVDIPIKDISIKQFSLNSNIATTCHKLQRKTLDNLVINSWNYRVENWVYVVLSCVSTLDGIVIYEKLDTNKKFGCNPVLLRWEKKMKNTIERKTFEQRGQLQEYIDEETQYCGETL